MALAPSADWLVTVSADDLEEVIFSAELALWQPGWEAAQRLRAAVEASKPTFIRS